MKMTMRTILAAGFVAVSLLSTAPLASATDNPADQPDTQAAEESRPNLDASGMLFEADQPTEEPKDITAERYRQILEVLRLPAVEDLQDDSASQPARP